MELQHKLTNKRSYRLRIIIIIALFLAPIIIAWWITQYPEYFTEKTTNHGRFLPQHDLSQDNNLHQQSFNWQYTDGTTPPLEQRRWHLLIISDDTDMATENNQFALRKAHSIHLSLNKNYQRAQRILISPTMSNDAIYNAEFNADFNTVPNTDKNIKNNTTNNSIDNNTLSISEQLQQDNHIHWATLPAEQLEHWYTTWQLNKQQPAFAIADPQGNIILLYDLMDHPGGILSDLNKLLRGSRIG